MVTAISAVLLGRDASAQEPAKRVREVVERRTQATRTFLNEDGSFTMEAFVHPVHFRDKKGKYQRFYNGWGRSKRTEWGRSQSPERNDYRWASDANSIHSFLPARAGGWGRVETKEGNAAILFQPLQVTDVTNVGEGNRRFARGAWKNTTLSYYVGAGSLKEHIRLDSPGAPESFTFRLAFEDLLPRLNADKSVSLFDPAGHEVFQLPAPWMEDANGERSWDIDVTLVPSGDDYLYTITPAVSWLATASYPVVIDPTIEYAASQVQTRVVVNDGIGPFEKVDKTGNQSGKYLAIGERLVSGSNIRKWRTVLNFQDSIVTAVPSNAQITHASLFITTNPNGDMDNGVVVDWPNRHTAVKAYEFTGDTTSWVSVDGGFNRNTPYASPAYVISNYPPFNPPVSTDEFYVTRTQMDIRPIVQHWLETGSTAEQILLRETSDDTTTIQNMLVFGLPTQYVPAMSVTYQIPAGEIVGFDLRQHTVTSTPYKTRLIGKVSIRNSGGTAGVVSLSSNSARLVVPPSVLVPIRNATQGDTYVQFYCDIDALSDSTPFTATISARHPYGGAIKEIPLTLAIVPQGLSVELQLDSSIDPDPVKTIRIGNVEVGLTSLKRNGTILANGIDTTEGIYSDNFGYVTDGSTLYNYEALTKYTNSTPEAPHYGIRTVQAQPVLSASPPILAEISADRTTIRAGDQITLSATDGVGGPAIDGDTLMNGSTFVRIVPDKLEYAWSVTDANGQPSGTITGTGATVTWTSPIDSGAYTAKLIARNPSSILVADTPLERTLVIRAAMHGYRQQTFLSGICPEE